ncbi:hypothetical protein G9A89_007481 [Geosiphon pyriformis]|nr:hypothetical protein G9A89_007481 [Geosiphon pyriformis]
MTSRLSAGALVIPCCFQLVLVSVLRIIFWQVWHYGIAFVEQLRDHNRNVFSWRTFKCWKRLDPHGSVPLWFDLSVQFLSSVVPSSICLSFVKDCAGSNVRLSHGFGVVCDTLLTINIARLSVYTDGSLSGLGTVDVKAGTAIFFENINSGLDVGMSGLAIALALECVLSFWSIDLFLDTQAVVDACKSESLLVYSDFRNHCWIECRHIANVIHRKNLKVNWIKVRGHSDISDNKCADALAKKATFSAWCLSHLVGERFLKTGGTTVSGNSRHFVRDVGSGSWVVTDGLRADVNWSKSSLVWHPNSHLAAGSISVHIAGFWIYFMKALHCRLPVAMRKCLYNREYPSVVCMYCGDVEILDYVFSCSHDATGHAQLLDIYASAWKTLSGLSRSSLCVSQLLATCVSNVGVGAALYKDFIFNNWYHEFVSVFKNSKVGTSKIVNFVCGFCLAFWDNIWLVCARHWAFMEKHGLISHDGSVPPSVSGLSMVFSAGVIRLLGMAEAFGVGFRFCKFCPFFLGIGDLVSVHIGV